MLLLALVVACAPLSPPIAERGIGGTGRPPPATAERGIGGTGGPTGTGIVGVITGFGSVFVDGFEVRYTSATPVTIDGSPASPAELRTGQVVAIDAIGPAASLQAQSLAVRHEVSGPVQSLAEGGREAVVAGQTITLDPGLAGASLLRPGAWVAVSGLRRPDGAIAATRIGESPPGLVRVHGELTRGPAGLTIGGLSIRPAPGLAARPGQYVTLAGRYQRGHLLASSLAPDRLATNPFAHFGPHVGRVFLESYAQAADGRIRTPGGLEVGAAPTIVTAAGSNSRWSVLTLDRGADGAPRATGVRFLERPDLPPPPENSLERVFHHDRAGPRAMPSHREIAPVHRHPPPERSPGRSR